MTRREQYGLKFYKFKDPKNGNEVPVCIREEVNQYSELQFISSLNTRNVQFIVTEIEKAQNGVVYDEYPSSDSYEDIDLHLSYPNVIIDEMLTIPMAEFKDLLEEWREFLSS